VGLHGGVVLIVCPEPSCAAPAEMVDQFVLWSTDGPVEHVKTYCVNRHIFLLPTERLPHSRLAADRDEPIRTDRGFIG
jgi:hypothetical protein